MSPYDFTRIVENGKLKGVPYIEKVQRLQVPEDVLARLSTEALVETCLDYPLFIVITAFNNIQEGFEQVYREFNGFQELKKRSDASKTLLRKYNTLFSYDDRSESKRGKLKFKIIFLEILLAQEDYLKSFSNQDVNSLLNAGSDMYRKKNENHYSSFSRQFTLFFLGKVVQVHGGLTLSSTLLEDSNTDKFLKTAVLYDAKSIEKILSAVNELNVKK